MLSNWIIYVLLGKSLIYLGQKFPLPKFLEKHETIRQWHECDLCMGVWVYGLLSFFLKLDILSVLGFAYVPFVSELVTGGATSFVMHIFSIGWRDKFAPDIVL